MEDKIYLIDELIEQHSSSNTTKSLVEDEYPKELMEDIYKIACNNIKYVNTILLTNKNLIQFVGFEGKNGHGDFLYDDMQNIFECMKQIRKMQQVVSVWVQEMKRDTCDDVSYWNICVECYY